MRQVPRDDPRRTVQSGFEHLPSIRSARPVILVRYPPELQRLEKSSNRGDTMLPFRLAQEPESFGHISNIFFRKHRVRR